jgi:hypothetical protein
MIHTVRVLVILFLEAAYHYVLFRRGWLVEEINRNDSSEPPSDRQFRWDLRHMREDLHMISISLHVLVVVAIAFAVWHW